MNQKWTRSEPKRNKNFYETNQLINPKIDLKLKRKWLQKGQKKIKIAQRQPEMNENMYEGNQQIKEGAGRKGS